MKFSEGNPGRIFVMRLEQGDVIPETIENFASEKSVKSAVLFFLGGAEKGSKVVVGPEEATEEKPVPMITVLGGISEAVGVGTLFLNEDGVPRLHLHAAFGRNEDTITGCTREGVPIWHVGEVIILEILNTGANRKVNPVSGFELLNP